MAESTIKIVSKNQERVDVLNRRIGALRLEIEIHKEFVHKENITFEALSIFIEKKIEELYPE